MIFKKMSLDEAKEFYNKLKKEDSCTLIKMAMDDIWFFTDGLKKDYGRNSKDKTPEYIQLQMII